MSRAISFEGKVVQRFKFTTEEIPVRIMVIVDGYAMVRRNDVRGAMPFVVAIKNLVIDRTKP